jgi:uncharacterized membrane protein
VPPAPPPPPPPPPGYGTPAPAGAGPFSVGDAFNWGWAKFQANAGVIIVAALIYLVVIVAIEVVWFFVTAAILPSRTPTCTIDEKTFVTSCTGGTGFFGSLLLSAVGGFAIFVLVAFLQAGIIRGALAIADGQKLELPTMFKFDNVGNVLIGAVIVGIAGSIGLLLCGVGYLVVAFFTPFWLFFVIDKNQGAWQAIMSSVSLVNKNLGSVVVLIIGVLIAYVIGAILCGVGLLVAAPVALLALTYGYRRLQNEPVAA